MIKEYLFLINANKAFSLTSQRIINLEDLKHKKIYACFYSSSTQYRDYTNLENKYIKTEIETDFKEQQNRDVLYKVVSVKDKQYVYIDDRDFIRTLIRDYNTYALTRIEQIFYQANKAIIESDKTVLIAIYNTVSKELVFQIFKNGILITKITGYKATGRLYPVLNQETVKELLEVISQEHNVNIDDFIIYGYNKPYNELIKVINSIKYKNTYNIVFEDSKTILLKKAILMAMFFTSLYPVFFLGTYIKNNIIIGYQKGQINKTKEIISHLESIKKDLYIQKGKTIILEDEIDFKKIAGYIYPINYTQPKTIDYNTDKQGLNISVLYDNAVLAYAVHQVLEKNKIQNTYYITPDTKQAKIDIKIPLNKIQQGL